MQSYSSGFHRIEICYPFFPTFAPVKNLNDIISPIAAEMAQFEAFFEKTLHADTEPMDSIMRYVLDTRGKRLRPVLVLLGAKLFGEVNEQTENIGARRLHTLMEKLLEEISFDAPDMTEKKVSINAAYVEEKLSEITESRDLSRFIL